MPDLASGVAVVLALVGVLSALSFCASLPRQLDLNGARLRHLKGVVTYVVYAQPEYPTRPWTRRWNHLALLSVDGYALDVSQLAWDNWPRLRVGERVDVRYRQGHSGREYVERIDPLPDAEERP